MQTNVESVALSAAVAAGNALKWAAGRAVWDEDDFLTALAVYKKTAARMKPGKAAKAEKTIRNYGDRVVEFSDKPVTVDGVKYQPKWQWSADYRKAFAASHRAGKGTDDGGHSYMRWLANRRFDGDTNAAWEHVRETQGVAA